MLEKCSEAPISKVQWNIKEKIGRSDLIKNENRRKWKQQARERTGQDPVIFQ